MGGWMQWRFVLKNVTDPGNREEACPRGRLEDTIAIL